MGAVYRDTDYSVIERHWGDVLRLIACGETASSVGGALGINHTVLLNYLAENPERADEFAAARLDSAEIYMDELVRMAFDRRAVPERTRADILKWLAAKRNPAYADVHKHDVTVKSIDLTQIIKDARDRLAQARAVAIDAQPMLRLVSSTGSDSSLAARDSEEGGVPGG